MNLQRIGCRGIPGSTGSHSKYTETLESCHAKIGVMIFAKSQQKKAWMCKSVVTFMDLFCSNFTIFVNHLYMKFSQLVNSSPSAWVLCLYARGAYIEQIVNVLG